MDEFYSVLRFLAELAALWLLVVLAKRLYYKWRLAQFAKEIEAKFSLLAADEQENFLYAVYGQKLSHSDRQIQKWWRDEKQFPEIMIDRELANQKKVLTEVPDFENFKTTELLKYLYNHIYSYWEPMRMTGDFNFEWIRAEFDELFKNFKELSKQARSQLKKKA